MNCEELFKCLPEYLDEEMKQEICQELEIHMRECPYCSAHVLTMKGTISLAHLLQSRTADSDLLSRLQTKIRSVEIPISGPCLGLEEEEENASGPPAGGFPDEETGSGGKDENPSGPTPRIE